MSCTRNCFALAIAALVVVSLGCGRGTDGRHSKKGKPAGAAGREGHSRHRLRHDGQRGAGLGGRVHEEASGRQHRRPRRRLRRGHRQPDRRQVRSGQRQPEDDGERNPEGQGQPRRRPERADRRLRRPGDLRRQGQPPGFDLDRRAGRDLRQGRQDQQMVGGGREGPQARRPADHPRQPAEQFRHLRLLPRGRGGRAPRLQARLDRPERLEGRGDRGGPDAVGHRLQRHGLQDPGSEDAQGLEASGRAGRGAHGGKRPEQLLSHHPPPANLRRRRTRRSGQRVSRLDSLSRGPEGGAGPGIRPLDNAE